MANWLKAKSCDQFKIGVPRFRTDSYFAEYEVTVKCLQNIEWRMYKRYSEFDKLNDEMIKLNDKYKVHFPPKKSFNNMSSVFLNNRRKSLEVYINELVSQCSQSLPRSLAYFLEMDKYEIHGITTAVAKTFFTHGNTLLKNNHFFEISVLHIHSINQRMSSPVPTNLYQKIDEDFGNVLDVVENLKKVKIIPNSINLTSDNCYGTSNIEVTALSFDISIFSSVMELQINSIEITNLRGLYKMNSTIERLQVQYCLKAVEDLLFADFAYKESHIEHLQKFDGPLRCATSVDFSHNSIAEIDTSIVTLRQVQTLNLSYNQLSDIQYMQHLTFLSELDLSYNNLHMSQSQSFSNKLGGIKKLLLRGNKLTSLNLVDRMFSLEYLDVSDNLLADNFSLLPLCRLSCLESLVMKDNPICAHSDFSSFIFDILLDRYKQVKINGCYFEDVPLFIQTNVFEYRSTTKLTIFSEGSTMSSSSDLSGDQRTLIKKSNKLFSVQVPFNETNVTNVEMESILTIPNVFNIFVYWFFVATGKYLIPKRLLWVTEVYAPNRSVRPSQMLLVTSGTHNPNMLKCRLLKSLDPSTEGYVVKIEPKTFVDLSSDFQHMIIGADKTFIRLDITTDNRDIFLCNNPFATDTFICHLYHVDEGMAIFGDSRIIQLNEEDRIEMMRRFIDVWRLDMSSSVKNQTNVKAHLDMESELLFISRAMLQMKNGFQILLTVVVTRELIYLVDERIYDWPDFNKHPNLSELWSGNSCSPYTSSCSHFPFLRTNAYFLHQTDICTDMTSSVEPSSIIERLCPMFRYPVQVTFTSDRQSIKDPLRLFFENEQKSSQFCHVIYQQCEDNHLEEPAPVVNVDHSLPKTPLSDLPCHLRHLIPSYTELRLCLSLSYPKLHHLAQSSPQDILSFYHSVLSETREDRVSGMLWSKFVKLTFDGDGRDMESKERPGLICVSSSGIYVLHEVEEEGSLDADCYSDPEVDQPDSSGPLTKWQTSKIYMRDIVKVYVGLSHQWLTICGRSEGRGSESERLVLMMRNKSLCKHVISWINATLCEHRQTGGLSDPPLKTEFAHQTSDIKELLYEIQRTSLCGEIELVHYCSLDDIRFDPPMPCVTVDASRGAAFSNAVVITTANITLIRHNVGEYPARDFAPGTIRQSPRHLQYQIMKVIPLFDCLQLQLPGHDRSVLIVVIKSSGHNLRYSNSLKVQLSICCQKEQKRLIDKLRHQRSKFLQIDTPLRVSVC